MVHHLGIGNHKSKFEIRISKSETISKLEIIKKDPFEKQEFRMNKISFLEMSEAVSGNFFSHRKVRNAREERFLMILDKFSCQLSVASSQPRKNDFFQETHRDEIIHDLTNTQDRASRNE